jgi:DNA segregation ATPase FtsK/SpoIIIE, S-DNA-T family
MAKSKNKEMSGFRRFLLFAAICLLVILALVAVVYWQWETISGWWTNTTTGIVHIFGWGIIVVVVTILTLAVVILSKASLLWRYWNKWLAGLVVMAGIWGILGLIPGYGLLGDYSLGGQIGQNLVGPSTVVGILIVLLIMVVGLFIFTPKGFAGFISGVFSKLISRLKREPAAAFGAALPLPQAGATPAFKTTEKDNNLKDTAFPKYKPEAAKSNYPVNGSKSWLWNQLHPQPVAKPPPSAPLPQPSIPVEDKHAESMAVKPAATNPTAAAAPLDPGAAEAATDLEDLPVEAAEALKKEEKAKPAAAKDTRQAAQEVWKKYGEAGTKDGAGGWKLPPLEILDNVPEVEFSLADNNKKAKLIEEALSSYGVEGKVVQINVGPTVTQFGVEPGWDRKTKEIKEKDKNGDIQVKTEEVARTRVKVDRITSLSNDLSLALAAPSIRIEAPVPGKSVVGIEVPNTTIGMVSLRGVVESTVFQKSHSKASLSIALGKGAGGESVVGDLTKMPHLLIAGATGSGKTVCIHAIICCLLLYNTPQDVRFIMIDPKRVELTSYNNLPHLATPVIVETNRALLSLRWLVQEMDKRYQIMAAARCRNIEAYNKARPNEKFPFLVLVIDELADLMMTAGDEVEHTLCRLAQLARAVGIHLIVATQRPSVDVVTGLIKANFPSRISFAVTSMVDSRTILDSGGAEKLLGRGDMLYMPSEASKAKRLQGCFLSDAEIERVVYFWNNQKKETASQLTMDDLVEEEAEKLQKPVEDPLLIEARKLMKEHEHVSASFLQRHLRIGYPRAARLMEDLEAELSDNASRSGESVDGTKGAPESQVSSGPKVNTVFSDDDSDSALPAEEEDDPEEEENQESEK